jgi:ubiquitin-protein ligase
MKEVMSASESKLFKFMHDPTGQFGEPDSYYLQFEAPEGNYEGQVHIIGIKFIHGTGNSQHIFPRDPPYIWFVTPIFHANISTNGAICLDVIKAEKWSCMYTLETIFNSILLLLENPNDSSPLNSEAAKAHRSVPKDKSNKKSKSKDNIDFRTQCYEKYQHGLKDDYMKRIMSAFPMG